MSTSVLFLSLDCVETTRKDTGLEVLSVFLIHSSDSQAFSSNYTFRIGTAFSELGKIQRSAIAGSSWIVEGLRVEATLS